MGIKKRIDNLVRGAKTNLSGGVVQRLGSNLFRGSSKVINNLDEDSKMCMLY